jgi:AraC-like DNA-binding protein
VKIVLAGMQCLLANMIVIKGLKSPLLTISEPNGLKYRKNVINDSDKNEYLEKLLHCMENESPYLDPLLTLDTLADKTKIPAHHISQLLNTVLNKSFYDFINSYRINTSKKMLLFSNGSKKTILEIMYDSGFASKSAFNNAFKKFTGLTPREYREKNANIV